MKRIAIAIFVLALSTAVLAQTQEPPAPVSGAPQAADNAEPSPAYEPTDRPLSGIQSQDIGTPSGSRNTLVPSFTFSGGWDSNAPRLTSSGQTQSSATTTLAGGLELNRETRSSQTSLGYNGGGQIYSASSDLNSQFHRFSVSQNFIVGRWGFLVADGLSYQKDAYTSFPSLLFPGLPGGPGAPGYQPGVPPGESIIGENVARINNTSSGQITYGFSRRTSLTANASYGLLHFFENADLLNTRQLSTGAGLDHKFGRNTIGVNYQLTKFSYENFPEKFDSHMVQLVFSHVLTGRWSFQAGGGPAIVVSDFAGFNRTQVYGSGHVGLMYHMPMTDLGLQYSRSVTNGSGALPGAVTDQVGLTIGKKLTKSLSFNGAGGYARNSGTFVNSRFNTINVGAGISRTVGRNATVSVGYSGQKQTGSQYSGLSRHSVVVSLNWRFRPIPVR